MAQGILILGLNGCGKTTLGRILAERLNLFCMDAEDYYFPTPGDYSVSRTEAEIRRMMEQDVCLHERFVLSCVRCNISGLILEQVQLAVVLRAPAELRASRIIHREEERFGSRVLPGGDMYQAQQTFRAFAAGRTEEQVDHSLHRISCPVIEIDASRSLESIAEQLIQAYKSPPHNA